jgi:hypothetical protein
MKRQEVIGSLDSLTLDPYLVEKEIYRLRKEVALFSSLPVDSQSSIRITRKRSTCVRELAALFIVANHCFRGAPERQKRIGTLFDLAKDELVFADDTIRPRLDLEKDIKQILFSPRELRYITSLRTSVSAGGACEAEAGKPDASNNVITSAGEGGVLSSALDTEAGKLPDMNPELVQAGGAGDPSLAMNLGPNLNSPSDSSVSVKLEDIESGTVLRFMEWALVVARGKAFSKRLDPEFVGIIQRLSLEKVFVPHGKSVYVKGMEFVSNIGDIIVGADKLCDEMGLYAERSAEASAYRELLDRYRKAARAISTGREADMGEFLGKEIIDAERKQYADQFKRIYLASTAEKDDARKIIGTEMDYEAD